MIYIKWSALAALLLLSSTCCVEARELLRKADYSDYMGKWCSGEVLETNNRASRCASECDDNRECDAYVVDENSGTCTLFKNCNVVYSDGCFGCSAHVCLADCPSETPNYLVTAGFYRCKYKTHIKSSDHECEDSDRSSDGCDPFEECYEKCEDTDGCDHFMVSTDNDGRCRLYDGCEWTYDDDEDAIFFVGTERSKSKADFHSDAVEDTSSDRDDSEVSEDGEAIVRAGECYIEQPGKTYRSKNGGKWSKRYDGIATCFEECVGKYDVIVWDIAAKRCYCWESDEGRYYGSDGTQVAYDISDCKDSESSSEAKDTEKSKDDKKDDESMSNSEASDRAAVGSSASNSASSELDERWDEAPNNKARADDPEESASNSASSEEVEVP